MYSEAIKVDMITAVHKLRLFSRLFPAGTQVFRPEPSDLKENGCYHYPAPQAPSSSSKEDLFTLPSTQTILETPMMQKPTFKVDLLKEDPLNLEPEQHLKQMLSLEKLETQESDY